MATVMTRDVFMARKTDLECRMRQARIDESAKKKELNIEYEDRMQDLLISYRRQRQALMEERDMKRIEIENVYKMKRREILAEDCELVNEWRMQLDLTPPIGGGQQHEKGGDA